MEDLKKKIDSIVDIYKSGNLTEAERVTNELIVNNIYFVSTIVNK